MLILACRVYRGGNVGPLRQNVCTSTAVLTTSAVMYRVLGDTAGCFVPGIYLLHMIAWGLCVLPSIGVIALFLIGWPFFIIIASKYLSIIIGSALLLATIGIIL